MKKYFEEIERPDLYKSDNISFYYNACKLNYNDSTKIEEKFSNGSSHRITVNDSLPLVGG